MNAHNEILTAVHEMLAPFDAADLAQSQEWGAGRVAAIRAFWSSPEHDALKRDLGALYARLHSIAGGKTWYNVFHGNSMKAVEAFIVKNCAAKADKRNAKLAAALAKVGVTAVTSAEVTRTSDGFTGAYRVETDKGAKTITINVIHAGGYNVQCAHTRVLVKVS